MRSRSPRRPPERQASHALVGALVAVLIAAPGATASPTTTPAEFPRSPSIALADLPADCRAGETSSVRLADDLLANRYTLAPHPTVTLPADPTWRENPLHDANWLFQYHSLRFVRYLFAAWLVTGTPAYRSRALFLLRDWAASNPPAHPASSMAWDDHATAWRAEMYACAARIFPASTWLRDALITHGSVLASSGFYVHSGNHALNQDIGLLEVGCVLSRFAWKRLAVDRLADLLPRSIDSQGVMNEGAIGYELYWYRRSAVARIRIRQCGLAVPSAFSRIDKMPLFLAHATLPDGTYEMIGDTSLTPAYPIVGTAAEYAATGGASGPEPPNRFPTYSRGYAFGRTGWGETRPIKDEVSYLVRFGPPPATNHEHLDATALTVYGYGSRLLLDSGKYSYTGGAWRSYFTGHAAHNVVTVDGSTWRRGTSTSLARFSSATMWAYSLRATGYAGVSQQRRVVFSTMGGYFIVEDRLTSSSRHTYRQLWHLRPDARPRLSGRLAWTGSNAGDVLIRQLGATPPATRIVRGATSPIQGWVSFAYNRKVAAPVVESRLTGTSVRFLTLIVPGPSAHPYASVHSVRQLADGFVVDVTAGCRHERVTVSGTTYSIVELPFDPATLPATVDCPAP